MEQRSAGRHDVIEWEDCRQTIRWCSRRFEESSLRHAVKKIEEPIRRVSPFFPADIAFIRCRS